MKTAPSANNTSAPLIGGFVITKIVKEHIGLTASAASETTFGNQLDSIMETTAMQGGEIQSIQLDVSPDFWADFAMRVTGEY